jgi:hypothetical protein
MIPPKDVFAPRIESLLQCLYFYFNHSSKGIWSLQNWQNSWKLKATRYFETSKLDGYS